MDPEKNPNVDKHPSITKYTWAPAWEVLSDKDQPTSPGCFQSIAKQFESGQLSYAGFLDAALSHITRDVRHAEDSDLTNLAHLSKCGPMGAVAAAIKMCMLCDGSGFSKEVVDVLRRMEPTASAERIQSALPPVTDLPPLQLQIVVAAAVRRGLPGLATDILSAGPEPPEKSLFNLYGSGLSAGDCFASYPEAPPAFWLSAVKARWLRPSPSLANNASMDPSSGPLLRTLLDDPGLDVNLVPRGGYCPLHQSLVMGISIKLQDPSLLRDILARLPPNEKLSPELLRLVVRGRSEGGAGVLALLLDYRTSDGWALDINYRDELRLGPSAAFSWDDAVAAYEATSTALYTAAENGNEDAVRLLISRGADVNEPNVRNLTPLHAAAEKGHENTVRLLVSGGADVNALDVWGKTARDRARKAGHKKVARMLAPDQDQGLCALM
ncbi:hypothetical protein F4777DRAFT_139740 [Nemania sp. FL0916]|nr:hypothetical protein F4777DRAFT_139740 [Nemania sp. FL0916]